MMNYLINNLCMINEYQGFYKNGIRIERLIDRFEKGYLPEHTGFDYGRFRVFIDSCLLLLNEKRLTRYYEKQFDMADLLDLLRANAQIAEFVSELANDELYADFQNFNLYHAMDGQTKNPFDQIKVIRNAFAHMQYGDFHYTDNGCLVSYWFFNKHNGVRKNIGRGAEVIIDGFIRQFYSNYSYGGEGLVYKTTFLSHYSDRQNCFTKGLNYYEITCKGQGELDHDGFKPYLLAELNQMLADTQKLAQFLKLHRGELHIQETPLKEASRWPEIKELSKWYYFDRKDYFYNIRTVLDFETILSNFLVHIACLNDVLYGYSLAKMYTSGGYLQKIKMQCVDRLTSLKEDKNLNLSFSIGFAYLKVINFALRVQDVDLQPFDYAELVVDMFEYDNEMLQAYSLNKHISEHKAQRYIVERLRNSVMHGNIEIEIRKKGKVAVVFIDSFNKREVCIKILLDDLNLFLAQPCLYQNVEDDTPIFYYGEL